MSEDDLAKIRGRHEGDGDGWSRGGRRHESWKVGPINIGTYRDACREVMTAIDRRDADIAALLAIVEEDAKEIRNAYRARDEALAVLDNVRGEAEALDNERDRLRKGRDDMGVTADTFMVERDEVRAEVERLRKELEHSHERMDRAEALVDQCERDMVGPGRAADAIRAALAGEEPKPIKYYGADSPQIVGDRMAYPIGQGPEDDKL